MRFSLKPVIGLALAAGLAGCSHGSSAVAPNPMQLFGSHVTPSAHVTYFGAVQGNAAEVCAPALDGFARCDSLVRIDIQPVLGNVSPDGVPGYHPSDLLSAYKLDDKTGTGQTVAVVDAYNDPNAESDLAVYRKEFGLPACTTKNGCFEQLNQKGEKKPLPPNDTTGWSLEESLDVDMVSAICPKCKIRLVEANSNSFSDLATAVDGAVTAGADAVSNSYGGGESGGFSQDKKYDHKGVSVTASTGDDGYGVQFPASSQYVTAVGGTTLQKASNKRGWTETVWSGAGSGCSAKSPKPTWQKDKGCKKRTVGDTAADANPGTGVAMYDTYLGEGGWIVIGGTSVASPIIASVYALKSNETSLDAAKLLYATGSKAHLFDVTQGSNGTCKPAYLCTGEKGYDGPTGNGTPNGDDAY